MRCRMLLGFKTQRNTSIALTAVFVSIGTTSVAIAKSRGPQTTVTLSGNLQDGSGLSLPSKSEANRIRAALGLDKNTRFRQDSNGDLFVCASPSNCNQVMPVLTVGTNGTTAPASTQALVTNRANLKFDAYAAPATPAAAPAAGDAPQLKMAPELSSLPASGVPGPGVPAAVPTSTPSRSTADLQNAYNDAAANAYDQNAAYTQKQKDLAAAQAKQQSFAGFNDFCVSNPNVQQCREKKAADDRVSQLQGETQAAQQAKTQADQTLATAKAAAAADPNTTAGIDATRAAATQAEQNRLASMTTSDHLNQIANDQNSIKAYEDSKAALQKQYQAGAISKAEYDQGVATLNQGKQDAQADVNRTLYNAPAANALFDKQAQDQKAYDAAQKDLEKARQDEAKAKAELDAAAARQAEAKQNADNSCSKLQGADAYASCMNGNSDLSGAKSYLDSKTQDYQTAQSATQTAAGNVDSAAVTLNKTNDTIFQKERDAKVVTPDGNASNAPEKVVGANGQVPAATASSGQSGSSEVANNGKSGATVRNDGSGKQGDSEGGPVGSAYLRQNGDTGPCAFSENLGYNECKGTQRTVERTAKMIGVSSGIGQAVVAYEGAQATQQAAQSGSQSGALQAAAGVMSKSGDLSTGIGTVSMIGAVYEGYLAHKLDKQTETIEKNFTKLTKDNFDTASDGTTRAKNSTVQSRVFQNGNFGNMTNINGGASAAAKVVNTIGRNAANEHKDVSNAAWGQAALLGISGTIALVNGAMQKKAADNMNHAAHTLSNMNGTMFQPTAANLAPGDALAPRPPTTIGGNGSPTVSAAGSTNSPNGPNNSTLGNPTPAGPGSSAPMGPGGPTAQFQGGAGAAAPGGGSGAGSVGSTSASPATAATEDTPRLADNRSTGAYEGGGSYGGGGHSGNGGSDKGPDLTGMLAQFLPKKDEEGANKNGILDFGGGRGPASAGENISLLDRNVNIFERIHQAYQVKTRKLGL